MNSAEIASADVVDSLQACRLLFNHPIKDESAGILLRSRLTAIATRLGFSAAKRQSMALVAAEMVSNQIKYAGGHGQIQIWQQPQSLDLFALDFGAGIENLSRAQQDGYSTASTLGKGLGAILRVPDVSGIFTSATARGTDWHGTAIWARFDFGGVQGKLSSLALGLYCRAFSDDRYNGDRIYIQQRDNGLRWLHLDGLGHGEHAQATTNDLGKYMHYAQTPSEILGTLDRHLAATRGAVAILSEINCTQNSVEIIGVGDMSAHLYSENQLQSFSFAPGVLGHEHINPEPLRAAYKKTATMFTCSDGIRRGWDSSTFPGLLNHHPQMIAYVLGNIKGRLSDDQSLCVVRYS